MMSKEQSLIVPVQMHAMCVGEDESYHKGSCFAPPTAFYAGLDKEQFIMGDYLKGPYETDSKTSDELKGIHLHWFLPDALAQVLDTADEENQLLANLRDHWFTGKTDPSDAAKSLI